jgi:hypothetical protein
MNNSPSGSSSLFKGRHFDSSIIILCGRWYFTYKLSYRDLRNIMAERGIDLAHTTILRWTQHYVPKFEKQWVYPMRGFKRFDNAAVAISGIELAQKIKKGQFDTSELKLEGGREQELWQAVLAA